MELREDQVTDLKCILGKHPEGIDYDALWPLTTAFEGKLELSRALHTACQQGWCVRQDRSYSLLALDGAKAPPVRDLKPLPHVSARPFPQVTPQTRALTVAPKKPLPTTDLPFGTLVRSISMGASALALYLLRSRVLTVADILELTKGHKATTVAALDRLVAKGYIVEQGHGFRWAGAYRYPFSRLLPDDHTLLAMPVNDWLARRPAEQETVTPTTSLPVASSQAPTTHLATLLDSQIALCEANVAQWQQHLSCVLQLRSEILDGHS